VIGRMASTSTWTGVIGRVDSVSRFFEGFFFFLKTASLLFVLVMSVYEVACRYEFQAS
jgi:hypothetical protein